MRASKQPTSARALVAKRGGFVARNSRISPVIRHVHPQRLQNGRSMMGCVSGVLRRVQWRRGGGGMALAVLDSNQRPLRCEHKSIFSMKKLRRFGELISNVTGCLPWHKEEYER